VEPKLQSRVWVIVMLAVALIAAVATIIAAVISALPNTSMSDETVTTATDIPRQMTPVPGATCNNTGYIPPLPSAPPNGCILVVEWWIPPSADAEHCGILITQREPDVSSEAIGTWWFVYPNRSDSHIREYQQKNPHCEIEYLR